MQITENVRDIMRSPEYVLNSLTEHSENLNYKFERLYRIFFNEEMYYVAYQRIYAKPGNMTAGADGKTIDQMSLNRIEQLITSLKDESYQPQPSKRVYIPKKNGKMRPLGVPAFNDKLLQEVVRMILEAIYERQFEKTSHGFRPLRSCHTALSDIQKTFSGVKWFVEGDIKGFFDNINHEILIGILKERIADERFIRLIRKFLNAGYIEDWNFHNSYSGTPQGGIVSPILANIYLDKLDKFMKEYTEKFDKGKERKRTKQAVSLEGKRHRILKKLKVVKDKNERSELIRQYKAYQKEGLQYSDGDEMDMNYRKLKYVRYADDFLIGIIGSKQDAIIIKEDIKNFLYEKLALTLSDEKTLITHAENAAKFLGYEVLVRKTDVTKRNKFNVPVRSFNGTVVLKVATETVKNRLKHYEAIKYKMENGVQTWFSKLRGKLMKKKIEDIVARYNSEIRGFYNYYSIANNVSYAASKFGYIMEYSMYHTIAAKTNSSISKVIDKYKKGNDIIVPYHDAKGKLRYRVFYNEGFKRKLPSSFADVDNIPYIITVPQPTLVERLKSEVCELCGKVGPVVMHHARNLNHLKGDTEWEKLMLAKHRKTLVVCTSCNAKIQSHAG